MNSLLICFFASSFASIANLFFRKGTEKGEFQYYLLFFYLASFVVSFSFFPSLDFSSFHPAIFFVGCVVGCLNMWMMWLTAKALLIGPAGLTFAFQNASGIFPGLILYSLFGPLFGFEISFLQIVGMVLIIWGLFLGSASKQKDQLSSLRWLKYALGCFIVQILALSLIHWRCLFFADDLPSHHLIPWKISESCDVWFLPGQFGTTFVFQLAIVLFTRQQDVKTKDILYGACGGIVNVIASFCLLFSTKIASPFEKVLIFPCFAATTMILCNIWANRLYQERFNWAANCCCVTGIFLGSLV